MEIYSVINDFGAINPNISQLYDEIVNSSITEILERVSQEQDNVEIVFISTISPAEKTTLDGIVASHIPVYIPVTNNKLIIVGKTNSINSSFTRTGTEIFKGSTYAIAKSISYMDSGATSYDIRILDKTNKTILLSTNLTNTEESIQDLGVLSNLSTSTSQIEVSIRKNGGNKKDKVYIESVTIYFYDDKL